MLEQITLPELKLLLKELIKERDNITNPTPERNAGIVMDTLPISRVLTGTIEELKRRGNETIEFDKDRMQIAINLIKTY